MPGFGLMGEVGSVLNDHLSLSARLLFFTNIGGWLFGITPAVDYAVSERFTIGGGIGVTFYGGLESGSFTNLMLPLRVTFSPWARKPHEVRRSGLLLGLELGGGVLIAATRNRFSGTPPVPAASAMGIFSIGYAWW